MAVEAVISELVSVARFPCFTRKYWEIRQIKTAERKPSNREKECSNFRLTIERELKRSHWSRTTRFRSSPVADIERQQQRASHFGDHD